MSLRGKIPYRNLDADGQPHDPPGSHFESPSPRSPRIAFTAKDRSSCPRQAGIGLKVSSRVVSLNDLGIILHMPSRCPNPSGPAAQWPGLASKTPDREARFVHTQGGPARLSAQDHLIKSSNDAIVVRDAHDRITYWSHGAEVEYGFAAEEAHDEIIHELLATQFSISLSSINQILERTGGWGGEIVQTRKDGSQGTYSSRWLLGRDTGGQRRTVLEINTNVSAPTRIAEAFARSEAALQTVMEMAIDAIITIDERGRIQSANPATVRMFGYTTDEMLGQNVKMLMPSPYQQEHDGYLLRYLETGEKRIIGIGREVQGRRKDGTIFPIDLSVREVESGRMFTGIIRDTSIQKLGEARLRESDRLASIGTLAAGLGHDMNNVLLPVRAHLNALKSKHESPPDRLEHLAKIQTGVSYLQQLADGLHFLAMDPDQVDDVSGTTDLHAWWAQTGALLSNAVPKHVKVRTSLPASLPEVAVAPHAMTQAVLNLIVNAGEAIPAKRKRRQGYVSLSAELAPDGSAVRFSVADNGNGMTDEVKRRAFDMFFTTKPRGLGTGLGLAMVQKVVDRAGGAVEVDSAVGRGTTISLVLPAIGPDKDRTSRIAAVTLCDGRTKALVRNLLEAAGAVITEERSHGADIWIVDPSNTTITDVKTWRKSKPNGRLLLLGHPDDRNASAWRGLGAVTIESPADLESLRAAICLALREC